VACCPAAHHTLARSIAPQKMHHTLKQSSWTYLYTELCVVEWSVSPVCSVFTCCLMARALGVPEEREMCERFDTKTQNREQSETENSFLLN